MADNTELSAGSGGDVISTDDLGSVKVQRVKVQYGDDGSATDVSDSNPLPIDDAGGSLTVDNGGTFAVQATQAGTWAVDLGATDNAVLDSIVSALGGSLDVSGATVTVDNAGTFATQAAQSGVWTVTANLSATDNAVLDAIQTATEATQAAVEGTLTVGSHAVTNAGTFAVQVDGAALTALQLIDNIVQAEDSVHGSGDAGVMALAVRQDSQSDFGADGDYVPLSIDANGALRVTGGGGGTQYNEDSAHTTGDTGTMALAVRNDSLAALAGTDGDYSALQVDADGALYVSVASFPNGQADDAAFTAGTDQVSVIGAIATSDSIDSGDAGAVAMTTDRRLHVQTDGAETENAAVAGNPNLMGGRYDSSARTLGDGDAGAVALNASGQLLVEIAAGAGSGGTAAADDADFTAGTTSGTPVMGVYESSPSSVTDGDLGIVGITAQREMVTQLASAGVQSSGNTTTSTLTSAQTYTGTGEQNDYQYVSVSCLSDNDGTLFFDFSPDGTNWNTFPAAGFSVTADTHSKHTAFKASRYFRVRFTDGGGGNTEFRLYTYYSNVPAQLNAPLSVDLAPDSDAVVTKAVLIAQASGSGDFVNVESNANGRLQVAAETDISALDGNTIDLGNGAVGSGTQRVTIASDSTGVVSVDDNGGSLTVDGTVTANLSATDNAVLDNIDANTARGSSHYRNIDANTEDEIKGSAGTLHWIHAINLTDSIAYLHLYDQVAASVTPGSTTPTYTFPVPTTGTASQGGGFNLRLEQDFSTGITMVCTTTTDGSTGDPGTNGVMVNAGYT